MANRKWNNASSMIYPLAVERKTQSTLRPRHGVSLAAACFLSASMFGTETTVAGGVTATNLLGFCGYLCLALSGLSYVIPIFYSTTKDDKWEKSLDAQQRALLGLQPLDTPTQTPAGFAQGPSPLLRPPQRFGAIASTPPTPAPGSQAKQRTPQPTSAQRSPSREVATPEQLNRVLYEFDQQTEAAYPGGQPAAAEYSAYAAGQQQAMPAAFNYRPSLVPKGIEVASRAGDIRPDVSRKDQKEGTMQLTKVSQAMLEVGVEKLREWFAQQVLQPLVTAIATVHMDVINSAEKIGLASGLRLSALDHSGPYSSTADDVQSVNKLQNDVVRGLQTVYDPQVRADALRCLDAIIRYHKLTLLLRGEYPAGLLPPTTDGYVLSRIKDLSNGTCMLDFSWNSGGRWNGKPWTAELPTDSALLLYLFSAFLAAPKWSFQQGEASPVESPTGILYLGKLPPKVAGEFYAILPSRPPADSQVTGIIGLQLGSQQPHFALTIGGKTVLTLSGQLALFEMIFMFLTHCRSAGGAIGGRSMEYIGLDEIVKPPKVSWSDIGLEAFHQATRLFLWPSNSTEKQS